MLTRLVESGIEKCSQYWPNEADMIEDYGDFDVELIKVVKSEEVVYRTFTITKVKSGASRKGKFASRTGKYNLF